MPVTATPYTFSQDPAKPELEPPLSWGRWQEVSDCTGHGDMPPFPPCGAGELWAQENVLL